MPDAGVAGLDAELAIAAGHFLKAARVGIERDESVKTTAADGRAEQSFAQVSGRDGQDVRFAQFFGEIVDKIGDEAAPGADRFTRGTAGREMENLFADGAGAGGSGPAFLAAIDVIEHD